ncbi:MAG: hypothetical protein QXN68_00450 [Thermoplasmata archaeon]
MAKKIKDKKIDMDYVKQQVEYAKFRLDLLEKEKELRNRFIRLVADKFKKVERPVFDYESTEEFVNIKKDEQELFYNLWLIEQYLPAKQRLESIIKDGEKILGDTYGRESNKQ